MFPHGIQAVSLEEELFLVGLQIVLLKGVVSSWHTNGAARRGIVCQCLQTVCQNEFAVTMTRDNPNKHGRPQNTRHFQGRNGGNIIVRNRAMVVNRCCPAIGCTPNALQTVFLREVAYPECTQTFSKGRGCSRMSCNRCSSRASVPNNNVH